MTPSRAGRDAEMASIHAREMRLIGEAGGRRNVCKRHVACHQRSVSQLYASAADVRADRLAIRSPKGARNVRGMRTDLNGELP